MFWTFMGVFTQKGEQALVLLTLLRKSDWVRYMAWPGSLDSLHVLFFGLFFRIPSLMISEKPSEEDRKRGGDELSEQTLLSYSLVNRLWHGISLLRGCGG